MCHKLPAVTRQMHCLLAIACWPPRCRFFCCRLTIIGKKAVRDTQLVVNTRLPQRRRPSSHSSGAPKVCDVSHSDDYPRSPQMFHLDQRWTAVEESHFCSLRKTEHHCSFLAAWCWRNPVEVLRRSSSPSCCLTRSAGGRRRPGVIFRLFTFLSLRKILVSVKW